MATKKEKKTIASHGKAYITATFNNTLVSITDPAGAVIVRGSAGSSGFKGARKSTPFAATTSVKNVAEKARALGMQSLDVLVKGPGLGRDAAVRAIRQAGLQISSLADVTPIPHNGCRPRKRRRV